MALLRAICFGILAAAGVLSATEPCNNSPTLCGRRYNDITYMGAHDSCFLRDNSTGNSIAGNQYLNATIALSAGLRFLQVQVHERDGRLHLCHTNCNLLDAGPLDDWLRRIADWIRANVNDVVTLLLVNANQASAERLGAAFSSAGLDSLAYTPRATSATDDWPTLQEMVDNKTRIVVFATEFQYSDKVPYLLPEFDFMFETPYAVLAPTGFNCTLDRPDTANLGRSPSTALRLHYLSLVNHFQYQSLFGRILTPDIDAIPVTNNPGTGTTGNFGRHVEQCASEWGVRPNFAMVDFWNMEKPIKAVDKLNGLKDITGRMPVSSAASDRSGKGRMVAGGLFFAVAATFATCWVLV